MTSMNVTISVEMEIDAENVLIDCVITPTLTGPILLYCEIEGQPAPVWVWDAIEAQLDSPGPIQDQYRTAYLSSEGMFHAIPL